MLHIFIMSELLVKDQMIRVKTLKDKVIHIDEGIYMNSTPGFKAYERIYAAHDTCCRDESETVENTDIKTQDISGFMRKLDPQ